MAAVIEQLGDCEGDVEVHAAVEPEAPACKRARRTAGGRASAFMGFDALLEDGVRRLVTEHLEKIAPSLVATQSSPRTGAATSETHGCGEDMQALRREIQELKAQLVSVRAEVKELRTKVVAVKTQPRNAALTGDAAVGAELEGIITLKLGSRKFQTTADTLRAYPDSFFGTLMSGRIPQRKEKDGSIFIDRDPKHFEHILNYMRNAGGRIILPKAFAAKRELRREADFYGLVNLVAVLDR